MNKVENIVRTRSLRGGHYRAGVRHGEEAKDWPSGTFTEEQLAAMRDDPDLAVEMLDALAVDPDASGAGNGDESSKDEGASEATAKKDKKKD
ncbi:MAG: hypothetical protein HY795_04405 [Desulfovibrio sp.]|nr:hypothetical protein [Desulfovibrio sp.]MBI4960414.1 hypothetical protein [Desulfovibrio sp.]